MAGQVISVYVRGDEDGTVAEITVKRTVDGMRSYRPTPELSDLPLDLQAAVAAWLGLTLGGANPERAARP